MNTSDVVDLETVQRLIDKHIELTDRSLKYSNLRKTIDGHRGSQQ